MSAGPTPPARKGPWPEAAQFNEAVQNLRTSTSDKELQEGEPETGPLGLPMPYAGNFADVYKVYCPATGNTWAVKFFKREVRDLRERYQAISDQLIIAQLPFTTEFRYLKEGVRIGGAWYPLVKMRWIEGLSLNRFVAQSLAQPKMLDQLFQLWVKVAARLRGAGIAHADLQHGNVVLVPEGDQGKLLLKLIDYDGMYVPALAGQRSSELGHPNYQHPQREKTRAFNAELDRFSHLAICCALRCLSVGRLPLWERFNTEENLLFKAQDFAQPAESRLFRELWMLRDPDARALVGQLALATQRPLEETPQIDALVHDGKVRSLTGDEQQQVFALLRGDSTAVVSVRDSGGAIPSPAVVPNATPAGSRSAEPVPTAMLVAAPVKAPPVKLAAAAPSSKVKAGNRRPVALATLMGVGAALLGLVRGIDWLLSRCAGGQDNVLLHNYFRVLFLLVTLIGVPWTSRMAYGYLQAHLAQVRAQQQLAARLALEQEVDLARQEWASAFERSDPFLLGFHAADSFQAARDEAEAARALQDAGNSAGALQSYRDALAQLTQAESTVVEALSDDLATALLDPDENEAERLYVAIKQLRPDEPRLAGWEAELMLLGVDLEESEAKASEAEPNTSEQELGGVITNSIQMKLVPVSAGEYLMGSLDQSDSDADERPQHRVKISRGFYIGMHEVTQAQYRAVTRKSPSKFLGDDLPVEQVSALDADAFCRLLTSLERSKGLLADGEEYRLPTEAEWEYAARAGTSTSWPCGDDETQLGEYAWFTSNSYDRSHTTGQLKANAWGIHDTAGNVAEWVLDEHRRDAYAQRVGRTTIDPLVQARTSSFRVTRGGSWKNSAQSCRSAFRSTFGESFNNSTVGFRVVRVGGKSIPTRPLSVVSNELSTETFTSAIGMQLRRIPAGEFQMGASDGNADERPVHQVRISHDFYLAMREVTQQEYQELTGESPSRKQGDRLPVDQVSAEDADEFCRLLTERERTAGKLPEWMVYRLPTEAQWEYAARAGMNTRWPHGDNINELDRFAWHSGNSRDESHPVGQKEPNGWGLYDMTGNIREWVLDRYQPDAYAGRGPVAIDPLVREGSKRVLRGGTYGRPAEECRSASRAAGVANKGGPFSGFRVALVEDSSPAADAEDAVPFPLYPGKLGGIDADVSREFSTTDSGLSYRILRRGNKKRPATGDLATVRVLVERRATKKRNDWVAVKRPPLRVGDPNARPGWNEAVQLIGEGGLIEFHAANPRSGPKALKNGNTLHILMALDKVD